MRARNDHKRILIFKYSEIKCLTQRSVPKSTLCLSLFPILDMHSGFSVVIMVVI